jgi:DNA replicative helicase MCM subunit Mcm2 (Cdc46/Mcm family)
MESIENYLNNANHDLSDTESVDFDKEKYTKFYELTNSIILFFLLNTYETQIDNINNENFNLDKMNELISNTTYLEKSLKAQLNIYWIEINDKKTRDQLTIDLEDVLKLDIIKHYYCLFTYVKNMTLNIMKEISRIKLEKINEKKDYLEKLIQIANAIMEINKVSGLADEDEFECQDCKNIEIKTTTFWN